jgi:non-heme chloroperoxidase
VGSRYPEKIAGLIYLDAGYSYAYYDRARGDGMIDSLEFRKKLEQLIPGTGPQDPQQVVEDLLLMLPQLEKALREWQKDLQAMPAPPTPVLPVLTPAQAILAGQQKYTDIRVQALAIYAIPHDFGPAFRNPVKRAAAEARDLASFGAQAKAFERGMANARVVRLPRASHFLFISNEADVLREMRGFLARLD